MTLALVAMASISLAGSLVLACIYPRYVRDEWTGSLVDRATVLGVGLYVASTTVLSGLIILSWFGVLAP